MYFLYIQVFISSGRFDIVLTSRDGPGKDK